jgi:hypothetical protein
MKMPNTEGWSRVACGMTQTEAEWFVDQLYFPARAMPDKETYYDNELPPYLDNESDEDELEDEEEED